MQDDVRPNNGWQVPKIMQGTWKDLEVQLGLRTAKKKILQNWGALWIHYIHCEKAKYASSDESEALTPEQVPVLTH